MRLINGSPASGQDSIALVMPKSRSRPAIAPASSLPLLTAPPPTTLEFALPERRILSSADLALFQSSSTHVLLLSFITDLNNSIINLPSSKQVTISSFTQKLLGLLDQVWAVLDEFPPHDIGLSRFGNKAFQPFYDALWKRAEKWHKDLGLPSDVAIDEVKQYFCESFGNRTRIDYGSGHELNFLAWILCFYQLSLLDPTDYPATILRVFAKYVEIMRALQTTYYLEPAGSHGVWGLDDYQFLPFLFGSAQLYSHPYILPKSIHNTDIINEFSGEYMYLSCVAFINSIKTTAGLRWHSPMLDDISTARNWAKINEGMLKMYEKEVLGKLPVMQHFMFGGLIPASDGMGMIKEFEAEGEIVDRDGMKHVHSTWGECCGIRVPSAVAERKYQEGIGLRSIGRIPFD